MTKYDTAHAEFPVCPQCGGVERAVDDLSLVRDGARDDYQCGVCGAIVEVVVAVSCTYSTRLMEVE